MTSIFVEIITIMLALALVQEGHAIFEVRYACRRIGQRQKSLSALLRLRRANGGLAM